jgi:hypothetical protein
MRQPAKVPLSPAAVAAAEASGQLQPGPAGEEGSLQGATAVGDVGADEDANQSWEAPLPREVVTTLLLQKYTEKFKRMGAVERMPRIRPAV